MRIDSSTNSDLNKICQSLHTVLLIAAHNLKGEFCLWSLLEHKGFRYQLPSSPYRTNVLNEHMIINLEKSRFQSGGGGGSNIMKTDYTTQTPTPSPWVDINADVMLCPQETHARSKAASLRHHWWRRWRQSWEYGDVTQRYFARITCCHVTNVTLNRWQFNRLLALRGYMTKLLV